jgi:hypothetical protein
MDQDWLIQKCSKKNIPEVVMAWTREIHPFRSLGVRAPVTHEIHINTPEYGFRLIKREGLPPEVEVDGNIADLKLGIDMLIGLLVQTKENLQ